MKTRIFCAAIVAATYASLTAQASAQTVDSQCPAGSSGSSGPDNTMIAQDACQKAIDLFRYVSPQLGTVLAGGNPTQGVSGTVGGIGHFSIGFRGNALRGSIPEVDRIVPSTQGAQADTYTLDTEPIGFVTADMALGVFNGMAMTGLGSVDLLVSASYVPEYTSPSVDVTLPSGSFKLGFGAKVGLLKETSLWPGVSLSYLNRELPRVNITGKSGDDRLFLDDVNVKSTSWRAVAGKKILFFGVGAGYGQDTYNSSAKVSVIVGPRQSTSGGTAGPIALGQKLTRNNMFGTVWLTSHVVRIVGEIGRVSGGEIATYNQFSGVQPADQRTYASVGLSFGR
jgi:hypothetical protein